MKKILLSGCNGKMGRVISQCVEERSEVSIIAGFDINTSIDNDFPVFGKFEDYHGEADVIVDFSHPSVTQPLLEYAVKNKIPAVIATTGLADAQVELIHQAANEIPVFFTANMSLGVNLLVDLVKKAAAVLGPEFNIEIIEKHHNQKVDAPSGTALMIADAINESEEERFHYTYDRHSQRKKRDSNEIGIHAVRGGTIVGEHEVLFAGRDEILTISHTAMSKEIFATGAVNAAVFLCSKKQGLYQMADVVREA